MKKQLRKYFYTIIVAAGAAMIWVVIGRVDLLILEKKVGHFQISDDVVNDENTGLTWRRCAEGLKGHECKSGNAKKLNWHDTVKYVAELNNNGGIDGYTDWRIPSAREMTGILDFNFHSPTFNKKVFPSAPCCLRTQSGTTPWPESGIETVVVDPTFFWSSTMSDDDCVPNSIKMDMGVVERYKKSANSLCYNPKNYVRLTRGPSNKLQFIDNGNGTVTETTSKLIWQKCPVGLQGHHCKNGTLVKIPWKKAKKYVQDLNAKNGLAGKTDWRIPNIKELIRLIDYDEGDTNVLDVFPFRGELYWTQTLWQGNNEVSVWAANHFSYFPVWIIDATTNDPDSEDKFKESLLLVRNQ